MGKCSKSALYRCGSVCTISTVHRIARAAFTRPAPTLIRLLCNTNAWSSTACLYYLHQLVEGVEYCHGMGVCHRDLKVLPDRPTDSLTD